MLHKITRAIVLLAVATLLLAAAGLALPSLITRAYAGDRLFTVETAPARRVAIVFGAGLNRRGGPSAVLRDRIRTAIELYETGKVQVLLMSGDNSSAFHDEPTAMKEYALQQGVPESAIATDFAGHSTYDTCYRAGEIFGLSEAILVTQAFHLPRAIFTCSLLGTNAVGVPAHESRYWEGGLAFWTAREVPATLAAFRDIFFSRPQHARGDAESTIPLEVR